jgi:hypothetical protein
MSTLSNNQTSTRINERIFFLSWLLVNILTLTLGWTNFPFMAIMGAVAAFGQCIILRWFLGIGWPSVVIAPIVWFYLIYGGTILGSIFAPLAGWNYQSPIYLFPSALIPGALIGLYEFLLFRKHLQLASRWIVIHAFTFVVASVISPYAADMAGAFPTTFALVRGFAATIFYSSVTGAALIWLRCGNLERI